MVVEAPSRLVRPLCGCSLPLLRRDHRPLGNGRCGAHRRAGASRAWGRCSHPLIRHGAPANTTMHSTVIRRCSAVIPRRRARSFVSPRYSPGATISTGRLRCLDITYALRQATTTDESRSLERWRGAVNTIKSIALSDSVVASNPRQRDAAMLAAQATAWSGNLHGAIERYRQWLATHADDSAAWAALAQTWSWANRPDEAREALLRRGQRRSSNTAARTQLEWTNVALTPSFEPTVSSTNDSDDNRSTTVHDARRWAAPWNARLVADGSYRVADLRRCTARRRRFERRRAGHHSMVNGRMRGELGASRLDASDGAGGLGDSGSNRSSARDCRDALRRISR